MVIAHNLAAMNTNRMLNINGNKKAVSTQRLSSGYKINRAADDAAGLSISEKMRQQIRGLNQGAQNIQEGVGYCQVADGALEEIQQMLQRITELSIKASNGTLSSSDRNAINDEIQSLKSEMSRICTTTKFNEEPIFNGNDVKSNEPYDLELSGILRDIFVYNDTFTDAGTTYGGIAYEGQRYDWNAIDPNMYNADTNTFNKGNYSLTAPDGSSVTLICEDGSQPPQISREFTTKADTNGIYINNELIKWDKVKTANGTSFNPNNILNETYSFEYGGIKTSFTPDELDTFEDVIDRISGIKLTSTYNVPTEETAVFADFGKNTISFSDNEEVKEFLEKTSVSTTKYKINATEEGLSLTDGNGNEITGSKMTWSQLGITDWGNGSTDIWSDKTYNYTYTQADGSEFGFSFSLVNETSKDSVIDAFNGVEIKVSDSVDLNNDVAVSFDETSNIKGIKVQTDRTDITLEEEYELGRDYSVESDEFGNESIRYDSQSGQFSVTYTGTKDVDGDGATSKTYSNTEYATDTLVTNIKNQIKNNIDGYINLITQRYIAGAKNPTDIDLSSIIGNDNVTGKGANTNFGEVFEFNESDTKDSNLNDDVDDTKLNTTLNFTGTKKYAGVKMDFSGLGKDYQLVDLIGTGFNTTCETCTNHYSLQFAIPEASDDSWSKVKIDGKEYNYKYEKQGTNYTLYVDVKSMQDNGIKNGVDFTNKLVDVLNAANYDFHFTQYATYTDKAELFVFDNRTSYVNGQGQSTATKAEFEPYAYSLNSVANFNLTLYDEDNNSEYVSLNFDYDWKDLLKTDNLQINATEATDGLYVKTADNRYEMYDANKHQGQTRYNISDVSLKTGSTTLDEHLESYIKEIVFKEISDTAKLQLKSNSAKYSISGDANQNAAMITTFSAPIQQKSKKEEIKDADEYLKIQCSSNVIDNIKIKKQKLSLGRMGITDLNTLTQEDSNNAIDAVNFALNKVSSIRSSFGAYQNRLEHAYAMNGNVAENTTSAESKIRDTDMALEMVKFSNQNILAQAGQAMLAQANQMNQGVLSLLS